MDSEHPTLPQNLLAGLRELVRVFDSRRIEYALIGGIASGYRSRPRFTQDIDILLQVPQLALPLMLDDLQGCGFSFDLHSVVREFVQHHITLLTFRGVQVDFLKPVLPLYRHVLDRATLENWLGLSIRIASAESLILMKLVAFRQQDQLDIQGLLAANPGRLDLPYIESEWATVGEPDDPTMLKFREFVRAYYSPAGA